MPWLGHQISDGFLRPLSFLLLVQSPYVGLGLWVALLMTPTLAAVGFLTLLALVLLDQVLRLVDQPVLTNEFRANGFLSALLCYWTLTPLGLSVPVMTVAIATIVGIALIIVVFAKAMHRNALLPISVWPYCLVAATLFALFPDTSLDRIGQLAISQTPFALPWDLPKAFLSGLGVFFVSPSVLTGAVIAIAIALWSPTMFLAGWLGWLSGALFSLSIVTMGVPVDWVPTSYNSFLVGMALGAVFIVPGRLSLFLAIISGLVAAILAAVLQVQSNYSGVSYLPIPFVLTLYAGLSAISRLDGVGTESLALGPWSRPEFARISADWAFSRWGSAQGRLLGIPLRGNIEIIQGVDGGLSHRGSWRHALDFQRPRISDGTPDAYRPSLWGSEVFAPVEGEVAAVCDTVRDNALGTLNLGENWGNYVIIKPDQGSPVMLCHLMAGSVKVTAGQRVSYDTCLGLVGNSGRSASPHLHLQRQVDTKVGSATLPFSLANYFEVEPVSGKFSKWRACGVPAEHQIIAPATPSPNLHSLLTGMLPGRALWTNTMGGQQDASEKGHSITRATLTDSGLYRVQAANGDFLEAEIAIDAFRIVTVAASQGSFIAALAMTMSTIPYAAFVGMAWDDVLYVPRYARFYALRELAAPILGAPLTHVTIKLKGMDADADAVLTCDYRLPERNARYKAELHLQKQRGPTSLRWEGPMGDAAFEIASFEVAAT